MSNLMLKAVVFSMLAAIGCFGYSTTVNAFEDYMSDTANQMTMVFNMK